MSERVREFGGRFWSRCTGPITIRGIVFVAVIIFFIWALFDRLAAKDHNRAMQYRLELYSAETQRGLTQIYHSWAKFDETQRQMLINQRAMQDEIIAQTAILRAEKKKRDTDLENIKALQAPRTIPRAARRQPPAKSPRRRPACFHLEDRIKKFGNGAEVRQQILVSSPCP